MAKAFLLEPEAVAQRLRVRYRNQRRRWLAGEGEWPLTVSLGPPSERQASEHLTRVRDWQDTWRRWQGPARVRWEERRWPALGTQRIPVEVLFDTARAVADYLDESETWKRAVARFEEVARRWPELGPILPRHFGVLADWSETDFQRLLDLLQWLDRHSATGLYIRQLSVSGVDSKWLETRRSVVEAWLRTLRRRGDDADLHGLTGLRRLPVTLRMRLLDADLRREMGGLGDISAPASELAELDLAVQNVFIVENLQTGLAFEDMEGAVVFMRQGYAVEPFAGLSWLARCRCHYWGDLDTHGFAILDRLRRHVPHARSLLMDEQTLLAHESLWGTEASPAATAQLSRLSEQEQRMFDGLRQHRWGVRVRLEQERIPWHFAWPRICEASASP